MLLWTFGAARIASGLTGSAENVPCRFTLRTKAVATVRGHALGLITGNTKAPLLKSGGLTARDISKVAYLKTEPLGELRSTAGSWKNT